MFPTITFVYAPRQAVVEVAPVITYGARDLKSFAASEAPLVPILSTYLPFIGSFTALPVITTAADSTPLYSPATGDAAVSFAVQPTNSNLITQDTVFVANFTVGPKPAA